MLKTQLWARQENLVQNTRYSLGSYGALPFRPAALVHPDTEQDIAKAVRIAADAGVRVRAIGSLHSLSPVPYTDGVCVVLDRYDQVVSIRGSLVTVQAGMTLRRLNEVLAEQNLALPVSGSIVDQTVSGAISTATHGGSIHHGSLSDCVEAVRIVRADGSVAEIDDSRELLRGVVVSLGLLGVISTVTLRCVPSFALQSRSSVYTAEEILRQFDDINRRHLYVDMLFFPITDQFEILTVERLNRGLGIAPAPPPADPATTANPSQRLTIACLKAAAWSIDRFRLNSIQRFVTRLSVGSSHRAREGRSDFVLAFGDRGINAQRSPLAVQDMEIAVPYDRAREAIDALRDLFRHTRAYPILPLHIRCSPRSALWLSPAFERDVCWIEFWQYPRSDRLFREVHALMKPLQYRFHWGKETRADREYISRQYERWDDFAQLRQEWDPRGVFLNQYLEAFFSTKDRTTGTAA
jgi:L-gulonolactone oxidase